MRRDIGLSVVDVPREASRHVRCASNVSCVSRLLDGLLVREKAFCDNIAAA